MLREFIKCATVEERINYLKNAEVSNCSEEEINTIMNIVGVQGDYSGASIVDKLGAINSSLKFALAR